jgi:hypothetical protein
MSSKTTEKRSARFMLLLAAVFVAAAMLPACVARWFAPGGASSADELAAKNELTALGALVVMDGSRTHVNSVNLSTLKSPDSLHRAVELLPAFGRLHSLNVDGTKFGDKHADVVAQLGDLQDLVLSRTAITDAGLKKLENLSRLKTIHLADTAITNAGMASLGELGSLNILDISGTKITGNFTPLAELSELTWLVAKCLTLDAAAIETLGQCESLRRVSLNDTACPQEALDKLAKQRPDISVDL